MMELQSMKYRFQGLDYIDQFYQRFIHKSRTLVPLAWQLLDIQKPNAADNTVDNRHLNYCMMGVSFSEYRYLGQKLDIKRKNAVQVVRGTEQELNRELMGLQKQLLANILWASDYIRHKGDSFWGSLHIQFHEMMQDEFNLINNDLAEIPSGDIKTKTIQVLIEDLSLLLI
ncbi:uncharacterized protein LOC128953307 [Oppia nitens]|uniref:uncharacterized protein LOC128953307 n=1 Tax=Oppia nitens TaxID=1686743 RepID=UPI0023DB945D|nr:uncharacterized protein LOC128953307 [Oppia nitens]